ncbi:MAG: nuclear transport factor 2 family protein [Acidimicrobiales bacterium]
MEHPNSELYRRITAAFQAGDTDMLRSAVASDVRWHEAGNPEVIEGRDAVMQRMSAAAQLDNKIDLHDVLANDEHVVAMLNVELTKPDGSQVAYPVVEIAHVKDGQVTERWAFMDAVPDDVTEFFAGLA